jgi:hypothetical protein
VKNVDLKSNSCDEEENSKIVTGSYVPFEDFDGLRRVKDDREASDDAKQKIFS